MVGVIFVNVDTVYGFCLVGCSSMTIWTPTVLSVLYACVLYFSICTCSAQLSTFQMERRCRTTLIIIIIIIIIIITLVCQFLSVAQFIEASTTKSFFLLYQSQRDVQFFCTFRMTFTQTKDVEKSSYHDRECPGYRQT